jgi:hypothetical protein
MLQTMHARLFIGMALFFSSISLPLFGASLSLDGSGDFVNFVGTGVPSGNAAFTTEAWINPDVHGNNMITFWGNQSGNRANGFRLKVGGQTRHFFWGNDHDTTSMGDISSNTSGPNSDGWHHLAITYDGSQTQWYWNGAPLESPRTPSAGVNVAFANHRIGNRNNGEYWDGLIDEVRIWNIARSAADIAATWDQGLSGIESNLVVYFTFENNYADDAGGDNNGSPVNDATISATDNAPIITDGPRIVAFDAAPNSLFEDATTQLSWEIDDSAVTGTLLVEMLDDGGSSLLSTSNTNGILQVVVTNKTGSIEDQDYTLRATETGGDMISRELIATVTIDPGIPVASPQSVATINTNALTITLSATDPNTSPNPILSYSMVDPPLEGNLSGTPPNVLYTPNPAFVGLDHFTFKVNDGRWDSLPKTITIDSLAPPTPPGDIRLSTTLIGTGVHNGDFVALLFSNDDNPTDTHSYALVAGTGDDDNLLFAINTNELESNADFSGLSGSVLSIRVRSTDSSGLSFEKVLNLSVIAVSQQPVINEIHYNPPDNTLREEFVELYNPGPDPINLTGYRLSGAIDFPFTSGPVMSADSFLVIAQHPPTLGGSPLGPYTGALSRDGETLRLRDMNDQVIDRVEYKVGFPWPIGPDGDGPSMQLIHPGLDNDLGSSWRGALPTPGAINGVFALNAPPNIRQVDHTPKQPASTNAIVISAKVTDPSGVGSVMLEYQVVAPGAYIPIGLPHPVVNRRIPDYQLPRAENPAYTNLANWTAMAMNLAEDDRYTATIPAQTHRTLLRYRITVSDNLSASIRVPYPDEDSRNFACFIYDGVPDYHGHSATNLTTLPVYHVLTRASDWSDCYAWDNANQIIQGTGNGDRFLYNWNGTIVYDGEVYDNIRYRLRGANGRYHQAGKRSMRFRLNKGNYFQARDQDGKKFDQKWRTLTTGKGFENRQTLTYALNERVNMYLWDKMGLPSQTTFWAHLRVIDDAAEQPDQYHGDFWGLTYILETYDVNFLKEHGLPDGNLYKLINQERDALRQQRYQASFAPSNGEDHNYVENTLTGFLTAEQIRSHVALDKYYLYRAFSEAIRNYDSWPSANKNMVYYFYPEYTAANNFHGKLWIIPWDSDATWGPTWNRGHDVAHNTLFDDVVSGGGDTGTTPELWPEYFNVVRELRDLLWQPDQLNPIIDHFASHIEPIIASDRDRWNGGPASAGSYGSLGGAGRTALAALVADMKAFAFSGGNWPGGSVGAGGRGAHLDTLQASNGQGTQLPDTPTITFTGTAGFPVNGIRFQSSTFSDPQGNGTFDAMKWQVAEFAPPYELEIDPTWETGIQSNFFSELSVASSLIETGRTYRTRVRHRDSAGYWSHWSAPVQFTPTLPDLSDYTNGLVISEMMYNPPSGSAHEWIEVLNVGPVPLDLRDVRFTKGIDFDFGPSSITNLPTGGRVLVVNDLVTFTSVHGNPGNIAGEWDPEDNLSDGGERVKLSFAAGEPILDFVYGDDYPWPELPDGGGHTLVLMDPEGLPEHGLHENWRASVAPGGTPGAPESRSTFSGNPDIDLDADGLNAFAEHALGFSEADPNDASTALRITPESFTFPRNLLADDVRIIPQISDDLITWQDGSTLLKYLSSSVINSVEWTTVQLVEDKTKYYGRLKIVPR